MAVPRGAAPREVEVHQEVAHEVVPLGGEHREEGGLREELPEEEGVAPEVVVEDGATNVYHMLVNAQLCIHEAFEEYPRGKRKKNRGIQYSVLLCQEGTGRRTGTILSAVTAQSFNPSM